MDTCEEYKELLTKTVDNVEALSKGLALSGNAYDKVNEILHNQTIVLNGLRLLDAEQVKINERLNHNKPHKINRIHIVILYIVGILNFGMLAAFLILLISIA